MRTYDGLPTEGKLVCEYQPGRFGKWLLISAWPALIGLGIVFVVLWIKNGSSGLPLTAVSLIAVMALVTGIAALIHFSGRGAQVEIDYSSNLMVFRKLRGDGSIRKEQIIPFEDIMHVAVRRSKMDQVWLTVSLRKGVITLRDSLSSFRTLQQVLRAIASQNDRLPLYRHGWFKMIVLVVAMFGTAFGVIALAIALGWI